MIENFVVVFPKKNEQTFIIRNSELYFVQQSFWASFRLEVMNHIHIYYCE